MRLQFRTRSRTRIYGDGCDGFAATLRALIDKHNAAQPRRRKGDKQSFWTRLRAFFNIRTTA